MSRVRRPSPRRVLLTRTLRSRNRSLSNRTYTSLPVQPFTSIATTTLDPYLSSLMPIILFQTDQLMRPRFCNASITFLAPSDGLSYSVLTVTSGVSGSSYGCCTPVRSVISPRLAFSYSPFLSRASQTFKGQFVHTSTKLGSSLLAMARVSL